MATRNRRRGHAVLLGIAYFNNVECVRLLVQTGVDPNAVVKATGETAFHGCVIGLGQILSATDRYEGHKLLVEHGAN